MSCETFPNEGNRTIKNPAINLFGNRFVTEQSPMELLIEFLLVSNSSKQIGKTGDVIDTVFPTYKDIRNWEKNKEFRYSSKARLNLKLFAFMGASRLDSRHETHRDHYCEIENGIRKRIKVADAGSENDVLRTLENLFLGFQGTGFGRTWCAQNFLPVCKSLLARETIWSESYARKHAPKDWHEAIEGSGSFQYFNDDKHLFLARGGEVLYLQLCNALRQDSQTIQKWVKENNIPITKDEQNPALLHEALQKELGDILNQCPNTVNEIAEFIDSGVESETAQCTDINQQSGEPRFVTAGNCPADSWKEGYLFAVDLIRLCQADIDVIERLQLLETSCAMQVLRSLVMKSIRQSSLDKDGEWPHFRFAVSAPNENNPALKRLSQHTAKMAEKLIYQTIRSVDITDASDEPLEREKILKEADRRYGGKLFVGMAKRIGFLIPRRGAGIRFTLNERLLRLLVVTIVPIGGRITYDRFKEMIEARYGLVFDVEGFARASRWADGVPMIYGDQSIDVWLQEMLDASGLLIHLSDACAMVVNPAGKKG